MTSKTKKLLTLPAVGLIAVLVAAGCGSSGYGNGGGGATTKASSASAGGDAVSVASNKLGKILVGPDGRTLYLFEKDKGPTSECTGACLSAWPPLTVSGTAKGGSGVTAGKLGTSKLSDGKTIVTYAGHPLYYYAGDSKPGQTTGQGLDQFGAEWYVVGPNGSKVEGGESGDESSDSSDSSSTPNPY